MVKITKLNYTLTSPEDRLQLVNQIIAETPEENLTPVYLEQLANYLILCMEKQERKNRKILTDNRMSTVNKREVSFEGLTSQMENGEDGIYGIIKDDKNQILTPKIGITQHDLDTIPPLAQLRRSIEAWESALKHVSGKEAFIIKKALIEMRKDQYIIKQAYQKPITPQNLFGNGVSYTPLEDTSDMNKKGEITVSGISFMDIRVVRALLQEYSKLKEDSYDNFYGDMWYMIQDFEELVDRTFAAVPMYRRIVEYKIDKKQNTEIQQLLEEEFGETHTPEYISSLWKNKIPKMIVEQATNDFIIFKYKKLKLPFKVCTKCGQVKPAHNSFFSINKSSKDGWYSICKECRNKKKE